MFKQFIVPLLLIVICVLLIWNVSQLQGLSERILNIELGTGIISQDPEKSGKTETSTTKKNYDLTVDMWQIFEEEMQDYKQRLRDGKAQATEQQSKWNSTLSELKKTIQEYDKILTAEGDFWEKQLKNYDRALAKAESKFDVLDQLIIDLENAISDVGQTWVSQEQEFVDEEAEILDVQEQERRGTRSIQTITPKIQGRGDYKTYPPKAEETTEEAESVPQGEVIRGSVTGRGSYTTY